MEFLCGIIPSCAIDFQFHIISRVTTNKIPNTSKEPYFIIHKLEFKTIIVAICEVIDYGAIFFHYITMTI